MGLKFVFVLSQNVIFYVLMGIIALSFLFIAYTFYWIARALSYSTHSIKNLIDEVDVRLKKNMNDLNQSIGDINQITQRVSGQMDKVDTIVENIEHVTNDARTSVHLVESTIVPVFSNLYSLIAGVRKGVEVWRGGRAEAHDQGEHGAAE